MHTQNAARNFLDGINFVHVAYSWLGGEDKAYPKI